MDDIMCSLNACDASVKMNLSTYYQYHHHSFSYISKRFSIFFLLIWSLWKCPVAVSMSKRVWAKCVRFFVIFFIQEKTVYSLLMIMVIVRLWPFGHWQWGHVWSLTCFFHWCFFLNTVPPLVDIETGNWFQVSSLIVSCDPWPGPLGKMKNIYFYG